MMAKVLSILGSPRPASNSTVLANAFLDELLTLGPETQIISKKLQGMHIQACTGCEMCKRIGNGCVLKDDMNFLYPLVRGADIILYASPVYWWGISGQLKIFMDRLHALEHAVFARKRLVVMVTGSDESSGIQYQIIQRQFQEICDYLSMDFVGYLPISADDEHPAVANQLALEAARGLAKSILV